MPTDHPTPSPASPVPLPCPFCGGPADTHWTAHCGHRVSCGRECVAHPITSFFIGGKSDRGAREAAIGAWNRRAPQASPPQAAVSDADRAVVRDLATVLPHFKYATSYEYDEGDWRVALVVNNYSEPFEVGKFATEHESEPEAARWQALIDDARSGALARRAIDAPPQAPDLAAVRARAS